MYEYEMFIQLAIVSVVCVTHGGEQSSETQYRNEICVSFTAEKFVNEPEGMSDETFVCQ